MLKIQIENLNGDKYDLEVTDGATVSSVLNELNKKYHIDTSKSYLCHEMKELENSSKITTSSISKTPKFILYNYAQFPEKSYPRVDDAFGFNSSRYPDYFVRDRSSSGARQSMGQMMFMPDDGMNIPEFADENDGPVREIYIPVHELNNPQLLQQLGSIIQGNQMSPEGLMQLLNIYRNASTNDNNDDYSGSEEEENVNPQNVQVLINPIFENLNDNEDENSNEEYHEDEIYDNDNYHENTDYNDDQNIMNTENNINIGFDDVDMVFNMMRDQQGNLYDGENRVFYFDNIGEVQNDEEENENEQAQNNEEEDGIENQPDDVNNEPLPNQNNPQDNQIENQPDIEVNDDEHQNNLLNQMAMAGMPIQNVDLNEHDNEVIARIASYGYDPMMVVQVYLACDKDEEATTMCLMSM